MPFLQQLKTRADEQDVPFIYQYYDVKSYSTPLIQSNWNPLSRMKTSMRRALEDNNRLPRMIIVMFDVEFMNKLYIKPDFVKAV